MFKNCLEKNPKNPFGLASLTKQPGVYLQSFTPFSVYYLALYVLTLKSVSCLWTCMLPYEPTPHVLLKQSVFLEFGVPSHHHNQVLQFILAALSDTRRSLSYVLCS